MTDREPQLPESLLPESQRPEIKYPCPWGFKVIGLREDAVRSAIQDCLQRCLNSASGDRPFEVGFSRSSNSGKYVSLTLNLEVLDENERNALFKGLSEHSDIKMVI